MSAAEREARAGIVVAIPTFRRPAGLALLLDALATQAAPRDALVIVGDNDCDDRVGALVEDHAGRLDVRYVPVAGRGVVHVRNALIEAAGRFRPDWRWLVMLDDDGELLPGWLDTLIACGEHHDADLASGPIEGALPADASRLARNSMFAARPRFPTGPVALLRGAQNLLISRTLLDKLAPPLFDSRYGTSGGEDYDLFRRATRAGAKLVWCDEAIVREPTPADRLHVRALLHRYYTTGIYMTWIDRRYDGSGSVMRDSTRGMASSLWRILSGGIGGRPDRAATGLLMACYHVGRFAGFLGARSARYAADEPGA